MVQRNDRQYRILWMLVIPAFVLSFMSYFRGRPSDILTLRQLDFNTEEGRPVFRLASPLPPPFVQGKEQQRSTSVFGLQFMDEEGNEVGGLGTIPSLQAGVLCFDHETAEAMCFSKVRDQLQISLLDKPGRNAPVGEAGATRVAIGLERSEGTAFVILADTQGTARMKLSVDEEGDPRLEFFDAQGKLIDTLPREK